MFENKNWIYHLLFLGGIGALIISLQLFYQYHVFWTPEVIGTGVCEVGTLLSCSTVNTSSYAKLLGVPFSLLGAFYSITYLWILLCSYKNKIYTTSLFYHSVIGGFFVLYFLYAEFQLHVLCTLCTYVHLFIIASMMGTWHLLKGIKEKEVLFNSLFFKNLVILAILFLGCLIYFN